MSSRPRLFHHYNRHHSAHGSQRGRLPLRRTFNITYADNPKLAQPPSGNNDLLVTDPMATASPPTSSRRRRASTGVRSSQHIRLRFRPAVGQRPPMAFTSTAKVLSPQVSDLAGNLRCQQRNGWNIHHRPHVLPPSQPMLSANFDSGSSAADQVTQYNNTGRSRFAIHCRRHVGRRYRDDLFRRRRNRSRRRQWPPQPPSRQMGPRCLSDAVHQITARRTPVARGRAADLLPCRSRLTPRFRPSRRRRPSATTTATSFTVSWSGTRQHRRLGHRDLRYLRRRQRWAFPVMDLEHETIAVDLRWRHVSHVWLLQPRDGYRRQCGIGPNHRRRDDDGAGHQRRLASASTPIQ